MKTTSVIRKLLVGAACVSFLLGTTVMAAEKTSHGKKFGRSRVQNADTNRIVLVYVTGSRIPQRVVIAGQQVNSASPLYVVQGDQLMRTGATSVAGMLALDPSVGFIRHR